MLRTTPCSLTEQALARTRLIRRIGHAVARHSACASEPCARQLHAGKSFVSSVASAASGVGGLVWLLGLGDAAPLWARGWDGPTYAQSSEHRYYTERWKHSGVVRAGILIHLHSCRLCYATAELQRLIRPMQHTLWIKRHPESYADSPLTSTAFHMDALRFRVAECSLLWPRISILVCMTTNVS